MDNWTRDLNKSAQAFYRWVWPILSEVLPGELVHVEKITKSDFARDLDTIAGIDAWHIAKDKGIRGIAIRMQQCPYPYDPYNTFTIRKSRDSGAKTEYEKRKEAIESGDGWLYPHLTVQGYVRSFDNGELLSFAIARTKDLIGSIDTWEGAGCPPLSQVYTNRTYNAEFYVVEWGDICSYIHKGESQRVIGPQALLINGLEITSP